MKTLKFIFLIGLPASGKSQVYNYIKQAVKAGVNGNLKIDKIDDVQALHELFLDEKKNGFKYFKDLGNNFAVEDVKAYDLALANLNSKLLNETNTDLRFIEFSRIKYDSAFKQFSDEVLKRSILIEMCCPFDICVKRNLSRKYAYASDDPDDHCVPDFVMEKYKEAENYDYEDFFKTVPFLNYTRFDNFKTRAELEQQLEKYFKEVLLRNISQK